MRGRRNIDGGRRGATRAATSALTLLERQLSSVAYSWGRGDTFSPGAIAERVASGVGIRAAYPTHSFAQASAPNQASAAAGALDGRPGILFGGSAFYDSSAPASAWRVHDGTGWQVYSVFIPKVVSATTQTMWTTRPALVAAETGVAQQHSTGPRVVMGNGAASIYDSGIVGALTVDVPTFTQWRFKAGASPEAQLFRETTSVHSGTGTAPSAGDPNATMRIGQTSSGGVALRAVLLDFIVVKLDDTATQDLVRQYIALRYPTLA